MSDSDSATPALAIDDPPGQVHATELPLEVVLTGTAAGVTGVRYEVTDGPSGAAENTAPAGDFSTWRAGITLPTTGTVRVTVVATAAGGGTRTVPATVELHL